MRKKDKSSESGNVVKTAGYKEKKRDKTINKKAGLHGKRVLEEGEARIYKRKPLAIKHKRRLSKAIPALSAVLCVAVILFVTGSSLFKQPEFDNLSGDYYTVCYDTAAAAGTDPTEHTLVEAVGYMNYTLQNQTCWSAYMESTVTANAGFKIDQRVEGYKQSYDGAVLSAEISKGLVPSARLFCVYDGIVLWRDAVNAKQTDGFNTVWQEGVPDGRKVEDFKKEHGLPASDFSVYVLNEKTILNANDKTIEYNGDGTYSMTLVLNVNTGASPEEQAASAVYYYKQQMAKTGGLTELPTYEYSRVTYKFDRNWRVLSFTINDKYEASMAGFSGVPCSSVSTTVYNYDDADCNSELFPNLFKDYVGNFKTEVEDKFTVDGMSCIMSSFSSVLTEGAVFDVQLDAGGKAYDGVVAVNMADGGLSSLSIKMGEIDAFIDLGSGAEIYLNIAGAKYKLNLSGITLPETEGAGLDVDALLGDLLGGEFTYDEEAGKAALHSKLNLFGIAADLNFNFLADAENKSISLENAVANVRYNRIKLGATLSFADESRRPAPLTEAQKAEYADILNEGIAADVALDLGGRKVEGTVFVGLEGGAFKEARATLGGYDIYYKDGWLYLAVGEAKYKLEVASLTSGAQAPAIDGDALTKILLNCLTLKDGSVELDLNLKLLFNIDGAANLKVDIFGGLNISADLDILGYKLAFFAQPAQIGHIAGAIENPEEYADILNEGIAADIALDLGGRKVEGTAFVGLENGAFKEVRATLGGYDIYYKDGWLYLAIGEAKYKLEVASLAGGAQAPAIDTETLVSTLLGGLTLNNGVAALQLDLNNLLGIDGTVKVAVDIFDGLNISADLDILGYKLAFFAQPAQIGHIAGAIENPEEYADILNEGIAADIALDLGGRKVEGTVFVGLENGAFKEVRATLGGYDIYYKDGWLYLSIGEAKYKLEVASLAGGAQAPAIDTETLVSTLLGGLTLNNGVAALQLDLNGLLGVDVTVKVAVDIFDGLNISADLDILGYKLAFFAKPAQIGHIAGAIENPEEYADILNEGIAADVALDLGGRKVEGTVFVGLENGAFKEVRATLGGYDIYYKDGWLYLSVGEAKYKLEVASLASGAQAPAIDTETLVSTLLNGLTLNNGVAALQLDLNNLLGIDGNVNAAVDIFDGLKIDVDATVLGCSLGATAKISGMKKTDGLTDPETYADILGEGVNTEISVELAGRRYAGNAFIGLEGGKLSEVRATLADARIYYFAEDNALYIDIAGSKIAVPLGAVSGGGISVDGAQILQSVLGALKIENGVVSTSFGVSLGGVDISAALSADIFGGLKINADVYALGNKISIEAKPAGIDTAPAEIADKTAYIDVTDKFSLAGGLKVTVGTTEIDVDVNNLALSFENGGIAVELDAAMHLNNTVNNFYIIYRNGGLKFVYGDSENSVGFELDLDEDLSTLENALVAAFNEAAALYNEFATKDIATAQKFADIMTALDVAKISLDTILGFEIAKDEEGNIDVAALLNSITFGWTGSELEITAGNISARLKVNENGAFVSADLALEAMNVNVGLKNAKVVAFSPVTLPDVELLSASDIADMLDYINAALNILKQENISFNLSGAVMDKTDDYAAYGYVRYDFDVSVEARLAGGSLKGAADCEDFYLGFNLALKARNEEVDDSIYLDARIFDGNSATDGSGRTAGAVTKDGELDVYLSVSKNNTNPLKIYMPMGEIENFVSMAAAMLNLGDVETSSEEVNGVIKTVADFLQKNFIDAKIPAMADKFSSLGASLIPQILGGSLSDMLDGLIKDLKASIDDMQDVVVGGDKEEETTGNFVHFLKVGGGRLECELNSPAIYNSDIDNLKITLAKEAWEGGNRLTEIDLENVYFDSTFEKCISLFADIDYGEVSAPAEMVGYRNFADLDTLLMLAVNSATHETTEEEYLAGKKGEYQLNSQFALSGKVTIQLNLSIIKVDVPINIDYLSINIDGDNKVSVDAQISYEKNMAIANAAVVNLTVKNDMIYIRKAANGATTYRVMPASAFGNDVYGHLSYILSFSGIVNSIANMFMGNGGNGVELTFNDYGDYIDKFLSSYTFDKDNIVWTLGINGNTLKQLAGIDFKNVTVKLLGKKLDDGNYVLSSLSVGGTMASVLDIKECSINYLNPCADRCGSVSAESISDDKLVRGYSWTQILGGDSFEEICRHTKWAQLAGDLGKDYIDYSDSSDLKVLTVGYEYATDAANTQFVKFGGEEVALYNAANGKIYTNLNYPDLAGMPVVSGLTKVWSDRAVVDGDRATLRAIYDNTYTVTVRSDFELDGFRYDGEAGDWVNVSEGVYKQIFLEKDVVREAVEDGDTVYYGLKHYVDGDGNVIPMSTDFNGDGREVYVLPVGADLEVYAVWERVYNVEFTVDGKVAETAYYYEGTILGDENLPEVPYVLGYTGVWAGAAGTQIEPDVAYSFAAEYTIDVYEIRFVSDKEVAGFAFSEADNAYVKTENHEYFSEISLPDMQQDVASTVYIFGGWFDNAECGGTRLGETANAVADATFYIKWIGKTVNITYASDVEFENSKPDGEDNKLGVAMQYGAQNSLLDFQTPQSGKIFYGWYLAEGDGYKYIESADALKDYLENGGMLAGVNSVDVTLWAVWLSPEVEAVCDKVSRSWGFWTFNGHYGISYGSAKSADILSKADIGVKSEVAVNFYLYKDGSKVDTLNSGNSITFSDGFTFSKSGLTSGKCGIGNSYYGSMKMAVYIYRGQQQVLLGEKESALVKMS